jgi:hypothetical protein
MYLRMLTKSLRQYLRKLWDNDAYGIFVFRNGANMTDLLANLKLDEWYKLFVYIGGILFILSLFVPVVVLHNYQVLLIAIGFLSIGVGEWRSYRVYTHYTPPTILHNAVVAHHYPREPDVYCNILVILGAIFWVACGISVCVGL